MSIKVDDFNLITVKRPIFFVKENYDFGEEGYLMCDHESNSECEFECECNDSNEEHEKMMMEELNIVAICKLKKTSDNVTNVTNVTKDLKTNKFSWNFVKYNELESENGKFKKEKRNEGFYILSNKDNVSKHLRKTKFCNILIKKGKCDRDMCHFAHTLSEFHFPECAFKENCKKTETCEFKHPNETLEEYKKRTGFIIPKNIK